MKKILSIVAAAFVIIFVMQNTSFTALKDFKNNVETEEKSSSRSSGESNSSGSCCIGDEAMTDIISLWFLLNINIRYLDYPYVRNEYDKNFIITPPDIFKDEKEKEAAYDKNGKIKPEFAEFEKQTEFYESGHIFFLTPEAGVLYAFNNGKGYYASLSGRFAKFIGPELEIRMLDDGSDRLYYYAAGGNLAIAQYGGFMLDTYLQGAFMRGVLSRNGTAWGFTMTLYPVKPLTFTFRTGFQNYGKIIFYDNEGKIGVMIGRAELSAGCRYIKSKSASITSISAGMTIHI